MNKSDESWRLNGGAPFEGKPIQLIKIDNDGKLTIENSALEIIKNLKGSLAVCSIVGPYRSGKSYILNLLLNRPDGFQLGATNESCTRGIWMWDRPIEIRNKHGKFNVLLMDTEGLGSFDRNPEADSRVFATSLLLSSLFIYNTMSVIDRDAIKKLGVMNDLAKFISNENQSSNNKKLPKFVWAVRDFFLKNNFDTANSYLENALKLDEYNIEANHIRELIKSSFRSLDCYLIPAPIDKGLNGQTRDETLRYLDKVDLKQLNSKFSSSITSLCRHICDEIELKSESPAEFTFYIKTVVEKLNKNERVSQLDSFVSGIRYAAEKSLMDAIEIYKKEISVLNPYSSYKCSSIFEKCSRQLKENLNGQNDFTSVYIERFKKETEKILNEMREQNKAELRLELKEVLTEEKRKRDNSNEFRAMPIWEKLGYSMELKAKLKDDVLTRFSSRYDWQEIEDMFRIEHFNIFGFI